MRLIFTHGLVSVLILSVFGCGGGESFPRIDVTGEVTFNGAPLAAGQVMFTAVSGEKAARSIAIVKDGKFATVPGNGPSQGRYTVTVVIPADATEGEDGEEDVLGTYDESVTISEEESHFTFSFDAGEMNRPEG